MLVLSLIRGCVFGVCQQPLQRRQEQNAGGLPLLVTTATEQQTSTSGGIALLSSCAHTDNMFDYAKGGSDSGAGPQPQAKKDGRNILHPHRLAGPVVGPPTAGQPHDVGGADPPRPVLVEGYHLKAEAGAADLLLPVSGFTCPPEDSTTLRVSNACKGWPCPLRLLYVSRGTVRSPLAGARGRPSPAHRDPRSRGGCG